MRRTHTNRVTSERATHKHRFSNQVGGANWVTLPPSFKDVEDCITAALSAYGVSIFERGQVNTVENWMNAVRYQDILLRCATDVSRKLVMGSADFTEKELNDKIKSRIPEVVTTSVKEIFKNVYDIITFGAGRGAGARARGIASKFDKMLGKPDGLISIIRNPECAQNLLMQSAAEIVAMLLEGDNYEHTIAEIGGNNLLTTELITKYQFFSETFVKSRSNRDIEDAWVMGESSVKAIEIKTFWLNFISILMKDESNEQFKENNGRVITYTYGKLAAIYVLVTKRGSNVFDLFKEKTSTIDYIPDSYPPAGDITGTILEKLDAHTLNFLLHLDGSVKIIQQKNNAAKNAMIDEIRAIIDGSDGTNTARKDYIKRKLSEMNMEDLTKFYDWVSVYTNHESVTQFVTSIRGQSQVGDALVQKMTEVTGKPFTV